MPGKKQQFGHDCPGLKSLFIRAKWDQKAYCPLNLSVAERGEQCAWEYQNVKYQSVLCEVCPKFIKKYGNNHHCTIQKKESLRKFKNKETKPLSPTDRRLRANRV